jgi:hypothetical protein
MCILHICPVAAIVVLLSLLFVCNIIIDLLSLATMMMMISARNLEGEVIVYLRWYIGALCYYYVIN